MMIRSARSAVIGTLLPILVAVAACSSSGDHASSKTASTSTSPCGAACLSSSAASVERAQVDALRGDCKPADADDVAAIEAGLTAKSSTVSQVTTLGLTTAESGYTRVVAARINGDPKLIGVWAFGGPYIDSLNSAALRYSNYGRAAEQGSQAELERIALQSTGEFTAVAQCVRVK
jgi:hypothetical protein